MKTAAGLWVALAWILLQPEPLWAWGPGTHIALGESVLASLYLIPPAIRVIIEPHPLHFLYGSIAADISFAKKYVPEGRHCHHWHVGEEILATADSPRLRAVGYGYLAHLAADTVAHNLFIPRQLLTTSTTQALGHTYWEHRMDIHVGENYLTKARHLVMKNDHSEADALFDQVLSNTIFSFRTNQANFSGDDSVQRQRPLETGLRPGAPKVSVRSASAARVHLPRSFVRVRHRLLGRERRLPNGQSRPNRRG